MLNVIRPTVQRIPWQLVEVLHAITSLTIYYHIVLNLYTNLSNANAYVYTKARKLNVLHM